SPDGKSLALTASDGSLAFLEPNTGKEQKRFSDEIAQPTAIAFSADGRTLVTGNSSPFHRIRLWDAETGKERHSHISAAPPISGLALSSDGGTLLISDARNGVRVSAKTLDGFRPVEEKGRCPVLSPDGKRLAMAQDGSHIVIREFVEGSPGAELRRIGVG